MRSLIVQAPLAVRIDGVPVLLRNLQRSVPIDTKRLCRMADKVLAAARVEKTELSIILVSDRRIRTLNERYRKKNRATDVLAFPLAMDAAGQPRCSSRKTSQAQPPKLLGDVVISLSTAQRQAAAVGHSLHEEIARLLVHGVLHLLGYDHEQGPREAARMIRQEHRLLRIVAAI
jgi:probable rRNA maturation factor